MLEGILFDADGVLVDSEEIYFIAVRDTFRQFGLEIGQGEWVRRWMIEQTESAGVIRDYCLKVSLQEVRRVKSALLDVAIREKLEIMPGASEIVEMLYLTYPLGIVSSETRENLLKKLGKFQLTRRFKGVIAGDDVTHKKPHPEPYQKGALLLGIEPAGIVVFEDNPSGIESAKTAGCKTVAYPNGPTKDMDFSHADIVVSSLCDVNLEMLQSLFV